MFKVKIDNAEYTVDFVHSIPKSDDRQLDEEEFRSRFGTMCVILSPTEGRVGAAALSIKDNYSRNIGRRLSFTRALKYAFPYPAEKEIRKSFWQAYYQARGGKW